jgi:hypothetical protein
MKYIFIFSSLLATLNCQAQISQSKHIKVVEQFKALVSSDNIGELANNIAYPIEREYPLPDIKTEAEFRRAYSYLFNKKLKTLIKNSSTKEDWSAMGWRGIMFLNGDLWLDYDGRLLGVHYQSDFEKQEREKLIRSERQWIHPSIQQFKRPVLLMRTQGFIIRIDQLENDEYRYTSWREKGNQTQKPDLIIGKGTRKFQGSGGNHAYEFVNGNYIYVCSIIRLGESDSPPAVLEVYENKERIMTRDAKWLED